MKKKYTYALIVMSTGWRKKGNFALRIVLGGTGMT
jgi:hypothetical protein